ncbi:dTDP-4-dehydrorhamnose reductase [Aeromonas caviae]|uniref:dTDP-4-dehydrorhamnose reductase n=1 Tax=Aeromonas caviae TaxID=648 RepID=UPI0029D8AC90|nr:dTDP-4-dehydrorhamnose reductase [Aeromonas caviae]MDX7784547.1 dTDP-4-dehydrorhamnose reductase [Aeromonas caviae]MDY7764036.1 dTDP-4-dehydrorhamnose reductase [Aeromonas caviae]
MNIAELSSSTTFQDQLILLLGSGGQLGWTLCQQFKSVPLPVVLQAQCDFRKLKELILLVKRLRPRVIINAAAFTQVEYAEIEPKSAYQINAHAMIALAEVSKQVGSLLVHFSTDYVFNGVGSKPWQEEDIPAPLNVYGLSKLQGEQAILASGCEHLIFRTSWLHSPYRQNFLKTMLHLGQEKKSLSVVCDQIGSPTSTAMLAQVTLQAIDKVLLDSRLCGLYHVAASGETSWYNYACFIFEEARALGVELKVSEVKPITSHGYPVLATRPLNSRLDTAKFRTTFGIELPDWKDGVRETLGQIIN